MTSFVLENYFFWQKEEKETGKCWWGEVESWINNIWPQKKQ